MLKKTIKFLRNSAIILVIFSISFSNVPFYSLTKILDSYVASKNIVDRTWHLSQNENVVDKFASFRNILEKVKVYEAQAAVSFVGSATASGTNASYNLSLTALTGGIASSPTEGDIVVAVNAIANIANGNPGVGTAGYAELVDTYRSDTYDTNLSVSYKIMGVTPDTAVSCNPSSGGTIASDCLVMVFRGVDLVTPIDVTTTTAVAGNTEDVNCPAITPVTSGAIVLCAGSAGGLSVDANPTPPTGYSGSTYIQTDPGNSGAAVASYKLWAGGAEDPGLYVMDLGTASANSMAAATLALRPAPPPDTTPPTPSPMTFLTPPANDSTTQISMTADTATDADTPPVSYFFTLDNTNCAADAGTGGTSSAWQAGTSYSDSGLTANKCYGYTVKARDSVGTPNETTASGISSAYTSANTPGTPALGSPTASTLNLTNAENSNPTANPTTNYAVQVVTTTPSDGTWLNQWVNGSGSPSATAVWLTDAQLDALVLQGLQSSTLYGVKVKAKNQDNDETPLSAEGQGTTSAPATTLNISQTAGSKVATKNSGDVNQYAHDTACTGAGTCSAFTLASAGGTTNVTSIKITENGTVTANTELSDLNLYYDYDGNWADAGAETLFGTVANFAADQTATVSGTLAITDGATAYIYARYDLANGAVYPVGGATVNFQIAASGDVVSDATESGTGTLVGTQTVLPNVTDATDSALVDGGRNGETFTITGTGFGTLCASILVQVEGTTLTCNNANNTTISATIPSTQITTYGGTGASGLLVTVGGTADDARQTYYVYPSVNLVSTPLVSNAAREGETITLTNSTANASRFGATEGTVTFSGGFGSVVVPGADVTWGDTSIDVIVPAAIGDTVYLGDITVTRNSDSKTDTAYGSNGFRVLPKITSLVPSNGIVDASVTVNGDHLCQSGTCPGSFSAANKVTFNSGVVATSFTSWSDTVIETAVPTGAITGDVVVTSNTTYTSNALTFTVNANTTTLATGSDPAVNTIAPGASATDVDLFTLQTNGGTESVTSVTVNLSTNSGIGLLAITDNANTALGSTASPVTGSNVISVSGMSAGTGVTTFKVRVTPLSHASMPAPDGGAYSITAPVTAWAGSNTHAGSDTNTNALTIDNDSPAGTTGATPTAGDAQVQVSWSNPGDSDFQKVIIYCKTSSITETPTEGSDPSVDGTACDATARVKYSGSVSPQTITGLSNGTLYYFRIYARDTSGNFTAIASTQEVSATPTLTQTLTVGTVGTQAVNLNSGSTAQHIGGAGTSAFTLQINTGSSNVTSVKVSETGTVAMANLANPKLYYENAANAASCAYGGAESFVAGAAPVGETVTFTLPSVAVGLTANVTCLYFVSDVTSSASGGQTIELEITNPSTDVAVSSGVNDDTVAKAITGTTTVRPNVTDATDSALVDGGRNGETFTITGTGFGTLCASILVQVEGTTLTCNNANNTTISATIPSTQITTYGGTGASGLLVTVGGTADDTRQTYYVYPSVNLVSTPSVSNAAREGETITLTNSTANASRFGATEGTVTFSGGFGSVVAPGADVTWGDTSIDVIVPAAIGDNVYLGDITVTRNSDSKTDPAYGSDGFRVLPRITSNTPNSGIIADRIKITGDHFCQGAGCPVSPNRSGANDNVKFGSTQALDGDFVNSGAAPCSGNAQAWIDTEICVKVPAGTPVGAQATIVRSNAYNSDTMAFTVSSVVPTDPTNLIQKDANIVTITTGETASSTPIRYTFDTSSGISGGTMYAQVEVRPVLGANKDFTSTCSANPYCFEGLGTAYGGGTINLLATSTPVDDIYHWQARVCYNKNGTHTTACDGTGDNPSALWVSYGGNAETATDFKIDATAPVISNPSSSGPPAPGTNTATITWTTDEPSTSQVQYQAVAQASCTAYSFASSCSTNNDCTAVNASLVYSPHTTSLLNLNSGTAYCYRVRSRDAIGNERIDTNNYSFATDPISTPAKTTSFYIVGTSTVVTSASPLSQIFSVVMPENATSTKSIFVEIKGIYDVTATSPAPSYTVQVNSETPKTYALPAVVSKSYFKILHQVNAINISPSSNTLTITPDDTNVNIHVSSADVNVTYGYTP